ncbi:MAG TPA: GNAT family N-acetyltransferase [Solirubrobacteraceae bacterium]|nr:GNAT family N-acetyltransferase [Solirubrobacteraceae bacterium]
MSTSAAARAWVAGPHEAEAVADLLVAFRDEMGSDWPSKNAFLASVERLLEDRDTEFLLASPGDGYPPAGILQLRFRFSVWKAAPDAWLEDLFVADRARRLGIGDALVALAVERARERGARRIELDTNEENAPALALYEHHGFSPRSKGGAGRDLFLGRAIG